MDVEVGRSSEPKPKSTHPNAYIIMVRDEFSTFKVVVFYSSLVVCLPIFSFFVVKFCMLDMLFSGLSTAKGDILSVITAVASLHFGLGVFIYRAFFYVECDAEANVGNDVNRKLQNKLE